METSLWELKCGERGQIAGVPEDPHFQKIRDVGIRPGAEVQALGRAPLGDPMLIAVSSSTFAIRREDAERIPVRWLS